MSGGLTDDHLVDWTAWMTVDWMAAWMVVMTDEKKAAMKVVDLVLRRV